MHLVILMFKNGAQKYLNIESRLQDDLLSLDSSMTLTDCKTKASITFNPKDLVWYEQTMVNANEKIPNRKPKKRF